METYVENQNFKLRWIFVPISLFSLLPVLVIGGDGGEQTKIENYIVDKGLSTNIVKFYTKDLLEFMRYMVYGGLCANLNPIKSEQNPVTFEHY